ncbi:MAG: insulinase family protein [Sedimentisphaerales bacterium]|nr:insulinase family protein [Sedimentisphaerales bacterium]
MTEVSSAAFTILAGGGVVLDPPSRTGAATVLHELMYRGAGDMDNRMLNEALDNLGLHRQGGASTSYFSFGGALIADNLIEAIRLHADVLLRPTLPAEDFELCRELALQGLDSLDDDPRQKISLLAQESYLPYPFGRPVSGKRDELKAITHDEIKNYWRKTFVGDGAIFAAAGKVDFEQLKDVVGELCGSWNGDPNSKSEQGPCQTGMFHHGNQGAQVHVAVMYPSVAHQSEHYYAALAAASVLSGGMGSRLFTEVREKRGLCYAVGASHRIVGPFGLMQCYLGSTPDNAQEALDVTLEQCQKLSEGIEQDELDRAKVGLRASLIMQGESSSSRASGCARDMLFLGRVRSLEEIEQAIQSLTVDDVLAYARAYQPKQFSIITLGPVELSVKS